MAWKAESIKAGDALGLADFEAYHSLAAIVGAENFSTDDEFWGAFGKTCSRETLVKMARMPNDFATLLFGFVSKTLLAQGIARYSPNAIDIISYLLKSNDGDAESLGVAEAFRSTSLHRGNLMVAFARNPDVDFPSALAMLSYEKAYLVHPDKIVEVIREGNVAALRKLVEAKVVEADSLGCLDHLIAAVKSKKKVLTFFLSKRYR